MEKESINDFIKLVKNASTQIKVMCWSGDKPVETHSHEFIEIAFLVYGSCIHKYHGSDIRLIPGDIFIITPNEEHSYAINAKTVIYNCLFYPEALGEDWNKLRDIKSIYDLLIVEPFYRSESGQHEILHLEPEHAEYMESLLRKMLLEQETMEQGYELVNKANLAILLCVLGRVWDEQLSSSKTLYIGKRDLLAEAIYFIERNLNCEFKIEDVASSVYLSPNHFRRIFKEATGQTPIEYINKIRISKASKLLKDEGLTISKVSELVGINDLNYFSRLFKTLVGCSPSDYKKKGEFY
jgi:AraC-like DNA-binding protein/quercetin dioxygenase-like cupin family protein